MDNFTHTLTGLAMSQAGLNRWHLRPGLALMLAANAPDIDIFALSRGQLTYFENHRGITHSVFVAPVLALLVALLVCAIGRTTRGWKAAWCLGLLGVASHLLLDWTNSYGVRLFLPFSAQWFRLDLNGLNELWVTAALLIAWLGPLLGRLVSTEIGAKPGSGRALAIFALSFFLLYDLGRYLTHQRAIDMLNSRVYQDGPPLRVAAFPSSAANPFRWTGWVERPEFSMRFSMNVLTDFDPTAGTTIYKPEPSPALDAARQALAVQKFLEFAQFPIWQVIPVPDPEGAHRVEVRDWRFPFTASATVDQTNRVIASTFHY